MICTTQNYLRVITVLYSCSCIVVKNWQATGSDSIVENITTKRNQEKICELYKKIVELSNEIKELKRVNRGINSFNGESQTKKPVNKPIDRNKIAPSEVSIEKYFYCGKK